MLDVPGEGMEASRSTTPDKLPTRPIPSRSGQHTYARGMRRLPLLLALFLAACSTGGGADTESMVVVETSSWAWTRLDSPPDVLGSGFTADGRWVMTNGPETNPTVFVDDGDGWRASLPTGARWGWLASTADDLLSLTTSEGGWLTVDGGATWIGIRHGRAEQPFGRWFVDVQQIADAGDGTAVARGEVWAEFDLPAYVAERHPELVDQLDTLVIVDGAIQTSGGDRFPIDESVIGEALLTGVLRQNNGDLDDAPTFGSFRVSLADGRILESYRASTWFVRIEVRDGEIIAQGADGNRWVLDGDTWRDSGGIWTEMVQGVEFAPRTPAMTDDLDDLVRPELGTWAAWHVGETAAVAGTLVEAGSADLLATTDGRRWVRTSVEAAFGGGARVVSVETNGSEAIAVVTRLDGGDTGGGYEVWVSELPRTLGL